MNGPIFDYLIDSPDDGGIETYCWLHVDLASTPELAAHRMLAFYKRDMDSSEPVAFKAINREWHRPTLDVYDDDDDLETFHGTEAEKVANEHGRTDDLRWSKCSPDDEGASEWWRLEILWPDEASA